METQGMAHVQEHVRPTMEVRRCPSSRASKPREEDQSVSLWNPIEACGGGESKSAALSYINCGEIQTTHAIVTWGLSTHNPDSIAYQRGSIFLYHTESALVAVSATLERYVRVIA
ncbi:hypothetical protein CABS01_00768 [Colletotrichum abscissum]|uniref:uncharacterized protein n=1 Tax=Colletotrichum abscissum TaxID=1671311 RepID=UPI0027D64D01|nr:uncharacterized protein CABS01_00768 [Colletotrichum abscissum]KAK1505300.1 hypothetical protein CABS01_00768 [Colletotrichum abscissum]